MGVELVSWWALRLSLFVVILMPVTAVEEACPKHCKSCTLQKTSCTTYEADPFPLSFDERTEGLSITYEGKKGFKLTASMVQRYPLLRKLSIAGKVNDVEGKTFAKSTHLISLSLRYTEITQLPDNLFGDSSNINSLRLDHNILMTQLPGTIFTSLTNISSLDLSYSSFALCQGNNSIDSRFENLTSLTSINLAGLGNPGQCKDVGARFFMPIKHIRVLNLSESGFLDNDQSILTPLTKMKTLSLNHVSLYSECPNKMGWLFGNLSNEFIYSLKEIQAQNWRSPASLEEHCLITNTTLATLSHLPHLTKLDFAYGDQIFGSTLRQGTFSILSRLDQLYLEQCRISNVENGAFDGISLKSLQLSGNPIGSNQFWVKSDKESMKSVGSLKLDACGINPFDVYNASFIVQTLPNVNYITLARNNLHHLPNFKNQDLKLTGNITLSLFANRISSLRYDEVSNLCEVMPHLTTLDVAENLMHTIELLCPSLVTLIVRANHLYIDSNVSLQAMKSLTRLRTLDLSDNRLTSLPSDLFHNMFKLQTLILRYNQLNSLDSRQFVHNSMLGKLNLDDNFLQSFSVTLIKNNTKLWTLVLNQNKLTSLDKDFVKYIESSSAMEYLTLDDNPFDCSCDKHYFQTWVNKSKALHFGSKLRCATPDPLKGSRVVEYHQPIFDCYIKWVLDGVGGLIGVVLIIFVSYRLRWYLAHLRYVALSISKTLTELKEQDECKYDAMVLFNSKSNDDTNWVKLLMFELEGGDFPQPINLTRPDERDNLIYIRVRDDITGGINFDQCGEVMKQSRKIIIVLSNSFLREPECIAEATYAGNELFSTGTLKPERILILNLEELQETLPSSVSSLLLETNYIDVFESTRNNEAKMKQVWHKLKKFVTRHRHTHRQTRADGYQAI